MYIIEVGDRSAKKYKWSVVDSYQTSTDWVIYYEFKTDSGAKYSVELEKEVEGLLDITFYANGVIKVENRGEMYRVMATISDIIIDFLEKHRGKVNGISFSPGEKEISGGKDDGGAGRYRLYDLFIKNAIKELNGIKNFRKKEIYSRFDKDYKELAKVIYYFIK